MEARRRKIEARRPNMEARRPKMEARRRQMRVPTGTQKWNPINLVVSPGFVGMS